MAKSAYISPGKLKSLGKYIEAVDLAVRRAFAPGPTPAEIAADVTVVDYRYPEGHLYRYVKNTTPGTTDCTTGWTTFLSLGGSVELDARVDDIFRITGQLEIKAGTVLRMGPQCVIYRDWAGTAGSKHTNACFKNENAPDLTDVAVDPGPWTPSTTDDDIYIEGGRIRPSSSSQIGAGYYMMGTINLTMRNCVVERTYQDWAFAIGGDNFSIKGFRVEENAALFEDGFHVFYGSGIAEADYVHSGDDCFAVGSNYNLPVSDLIIKMGTFYSEKAYAIKVVQNRTGSTAGFATPDQKIERVQFLSGSGQAGVSRNGLVWTTADAADLLLDITIDGVTIDAGTETHDGVNPFGVLCEDVTRLRLRSVTAINARRHAFHIHDCPQAELIGCVAKDSQGVSTYRALEIEDCIDMRVIGGEYIRTLTHPIHTTGICSVSFQGMLIREIGDSFAGILVEGTSDVSVNGVTFRKASGATSSAGINCNSTTASIVADGCIWGIDRPFAQSATAAYARLSKVRRTGVTIAAGAITTYGDDDIELLCEGGVADSLVTINGGYKGQTLTLRNGEADPATDTITVTAATGSNQPDIGSNYVMGSADSFIRLYFDGTNWELVHQGD